MQLLELEPARASLLDYSEYSSYDEDRQKVTLTATVKPEGVGGEIVVEGGRTTKVAPDDIRDRVNAVTSGSTRP